MAREAATPPAARIAVERALLALEPGWTIRADWHLGEPPEAAAADYLLLHARKGIALVDAGGSRGDGAAVLRRVLEQQGFSASFPGTLPIVDVIAAPGGPLALAERLEEAFAAAPALTIAEPDWAAAARLLVAAAPAPERSVFARPVVPEPAMVASAARRRRWPLTAAAAIAALLGAVGTWVALTPKTAPVAKLELALPPAGPTGDKVAAAPPAATPSPPPPAVEGNDAPATENAAPSAPSTPAPPEAPIPAPPPLPARKPLPAKSVAIRPAAAATVRPPRDTRPATVARLAAATPIIEPMRRDCRTYLAPLTVLGQRRAVTGIACRTADGTWQLVSEMPR